MFYTAVRSQKVVRWHGRAGVQRREQCRRQVVCPQAGENEYPISAVVLPGEVSRQKEERKGRQWCAGMWQAERWCGSAVQKCVECRDSLQRRWQV